MNKHGQAAKFAYDPTLVCLFIDQSRKAGDGGHGGTSGNGFEAIVAEGWTDNHHGRTLRRWRKGHVGVTKHALENFLSPWYPRGDGNTTFLVWCQVRDLDPVLRDKTTGGKR